MTDLAGFGVPDFLPLATRKALQAEEVREYREAKEAEAKRERLAEAHRSANLAMFRDQAEARGEHVSAMALATGQVTGRSIGDIFAEASAAADIADAREAARQRREDGERLNLCFGETSRAKAAETPEGREILNTVRRYKALYQDSDVIDRARIASAARAAQRRDRPVSEQARLDHHAAQHPAGPSPSEAAHSDREQRLAADEAQLRLPPSEQPHGREVLSYHQGRPTVEEQMSSHGAAPPKVPDVGGHG